MDLFKDVQKGLQTCRAIWVERLPGEEEAPEKRIIHSRILQFPCKANLERIGIKLGYGYFKCGGQAEQDWIQDFRVLIENDGNWVELLEKRNHERPIDSDAVDWIDLGHVKADAVIIEIRRSAIDNWWPSWNTAMNCIMIEGTIEAYKYKPAEKMLHNVRIGDCESVSGVQMCLSGSEVRYRTKFLEVGFLLKRAALSYLSIDEEGKERTLTNLLKSNAYPIVPNPSVSYYMQGPRLNPVNMVEEMGMYQYDTEGNTEVSGNKIKYSVKCRHTGQSYTIQWEVFEDNITLNIERYGEKPLRAWNSSAWHISFETTAAPLTALGRATKSGECGMVEVPLTLHLPRFGSLEVSTEKGECTGRFDSVRPLLINTFELKVGEVAQPEGDYLLLPGKHEAVVKFKVKTPKLVETKDGIPDIVKKMIDLRSVTAITYRVDTDTLSNNGNSMHAPICMDCWAETITGFSEPISGVEPQEFLRNTLERWINGAPAYASGRSGNKEGHYYEDEYLMTGTASILGLARYLDVYDDKKWFESFYDSIIDEINRMKARDLDGDGLVESKYRVGISGEYQWSTCWFDVISFGWKDAFANTLLYPALRILERKFSEYGKPEVSQDLREWADRFKENYVKAFYNVKTRWLAGWKCKEGKLHDYAFLFVNGAAVEYGIIEGELAKDIMNRLWNELMKSEFKDFTLGLPGNLWRIPDEDLARLQHYVPMGTYQNGGATHSQARHFISGLYKVGMTAEGDTLLEEMSKSMAEGTAFGGINSGVDWRMWDGTSCGYEGLLTDQFGILVSAMQRWAKSYPGVKG